MKKLINRPEDVLDEMLDGMVALYPGIRRVSGQNVIVRRDSETMRSQQVTLISGGGSGHEPAHAGYVGRGMLTAAVAGEVFTSPGPESVLSAIHEVGDPSGPGTLLIVKNYTGDRLNFAEAARRAIGQGYRIETVVVADDAALAGTDSRAGARGLAGTILVHKVAGAAASAGLSLEEVAREAQLASDSVATMGVALSACTVPLAGKPGFSLADDEMELGLGIHGEPGIHAGKLKPVDEVVRMMLCDVILPRLSPAANDRVVLLVNNLGATPVMELAIAARKAIAVLEEKGLVVERVYSGTFLSALDMAGISLSVMLVDDLRLSRLDAETDAPAWPNAASHPHVVRSRSMAENRPAANNESDLRDKLSGWKAPATSDSGGLLASSIQQVILTLLDSAERLNELDRVVGDGDMGSNLASGARAVASRLLGEPSLPFGSPGKCLAEITSILGTVLGGSSGPLLTDLLLPFTKLDRAKVSDAPAGQSQWLPSISSALSEGIAAVSARGGAGPGDRTLLDALYPASQALADSISQEIGLSPALDAAASAASLGANGTAQLRPRFGRASYLGDRALGHPDPGAVAVSLVFEALAESVRRASP